MMQKEFPTILLRIEFTEENLKENKFNEFVRIPVINENFSLEINNIKRIIN